MLERPFKARWRTRFAGARYGYLLSYPRSGSHWTRYLVEAITGAPTLGAYDGFHARASSLGPDGPIRWRVPIERRTREPVAVKRHAMLDTDDDGRPLVLIVRDPSVAILSHGMQPVTGRRVMHAELASFAANVYTYDAWKGPAVLVRYEDLVGSDATLLDTATRVLETLGVQGFEAPLDAFVRQRDEHAGIAKQSLQRTPFSAKVDWDAPAVRTMRLAVLRSLANYATQGSTLEAIVNDANGKLAMIR